MGVDQLVSRHCEYPQQDALRINQSHTQDGIWGRTDQRRSLWKCHGMSVSYLHPDLYFFVLNSKILV